MNNFSTLTSIISALGTAPIHRLSRTWAQVNARTMTILEALRRLMGSTKNFGEYRETLHLANPPCIPFFGKPLSASTLPHTLSFSLPTLLLRNKSSPVLSPWLFRRLPHRPHLHRRRHPLSHKTHPPHQLRQARQDRRSNPRHPAIPECSLPPEISGGLAGLYTQQHASGGGRA